jgi:hypothetical protein
MLLLTLAAVGALVAFALELRAGEHDRSVYEAAPVCTTTVTSSCKSQFVVTITDKGSTAGKSPTYYLEISGVFPADGRIDLPAQTRLWYVAAAGDPATATVWDKTVASIDVYGISGDTVQTPGESIPTLELIVTAAVIWAVMLAMFAWRIDRSTNGRYGAIDRIMPALNLYLFFPALGFIFGSILASQEDSLAAGVIAGTVISAVGAIFILFDARRKS